MSALSFSRPWGYCLAAMPIAFILLTLSALSLTPAHAAPTAPTFTVNSPSDVPDANPGDGICATGGGVCTLRAAIQEANKTAGGGTTINFASTATPVSYTLSLGALVISNTLTIAGNGAAKTIIDGNGGVTNDRVITVMTHTVSISGVTITNGKPSGLNAFGGGILHNDALTLTNVIVSGNSANSSSGAAYGGGIYSSGRLVLINSSVINNSAKTATGIASGGGIVGGFGLMVTNSTVSGNTAHDSGGGILSGGTFINSTINGNSARNGGGINGGALTLINSTVSGNYAHDNGGGIYHASSPANLFNVTIADNTANSDSSGVGFGGGISNASGTVNFQNSIIGNNVQVLVINGNPVANPEDCSGTLTSVGYNLVSGTTDCTINGSFTQAYPNLGPLQNNGGPTQTQALLAGSPAIDAGNPGGCTDNLGAILTTDQRGYLRPVDGDGNSSSICDDGAFEYSAVPPNNTVEENDIHVQYNGWRGVSDASANGGTFRESNVQNDKATFKFKGTSVKWVTHKGPNMGKALVTIDGVNLPVVDLYKSTPQPFTWTSPGLANANHTILVKVLHQKNGSATDYTVAVDAFAFGTTTTQDTNCKIKYDTWACLANASASGGSYRFSTSASGRMSLTFTGDSI